MSHVTLEQAKRLKELGYPQGDLNEIGRAVQCNCGLQMMHVDLDTDWTVGIDYTHLAHDWDIDHKWYRAPSAEELMEWLKGMDVEIHLFNYPGVWHADVFDSKREPLHEDGQLIDILFQAACWVLEQKNLAP